MFDVRIKREKNLSGSRNSDQIYTGYFGNVKTESVETDAKEWKIHSEVDLGITYKNLQCPKQEITCVNNMVITSPDNVDDSLNSFATEHCQTIKTELLNSPVNSVDAESMEDIKVHSEIVFGMQLEEKELKNIHCSSSTDDSEVEYSGLNHYVKAEPLNILEEDLDVSSEAVQHTKDTWIDNTNETNTLHNVSTENEKHFNNESMQKKFIYKEKSTVIKSDRSLVMCKTCKKTYSNSSSIERHVCSDKNDKQYVCGFCGAIFSRSDMLKRHHFIHTGERPFVCTICQKTFNQRWNLKAHRVVHTKEKLYKCNQCLKTFTQAGTLKRHQFVHTGEKPFACSVCEKTFAKLCSLKDHEVIHSTVREFSCKTCNKKFYDSRSLRRHSFIHTEVKRYSCGICKKGFTYRSNVKRHLRCHTGERPYSCNICKKTFAETSTLRRHRKTHEDNSYTCKVCEQVFKDLVNLKLHELVHDNK